MSHYKDRLMRAIDAEPKSFVTCSLGLVPRFGSPARREKDCKLDCRDYNACEKQRKERVRG